MNSPYTRLQIRVGGGEKAAGSGPRLELWLAQRTRVQPSPLPERHRMLRSCASPSEPHRLKRFRASPDLPLSLLPPRRP